MARSSEERGPAAGWATAGAAENSDNRAHGIRRSRISTSAEVDPRNRARVAESVNPGSGPPLEGVRYRADELQRLDAMNWSRAHIRADLTAKGRRREPPVMEQSSQPSAVHPE